MGFILGILMICVMAFALWYFLLRAEPVARKNVPDTEWEEKLNKAYDMLCAAYKDLHTTEDEFEKKMVDVNNLVKLAIECGGADAEKQWRGMVAVITERIEELRQKIDRELHRIENQGKKLWARLVKNLGRPLAFVVAGLAVLAAGYIIACIIHGIKCI